jgi:anaerobic selenocysteine-containing dehydrogenase
LTIEDGRVTGARGDRDDVFSHGYICPKGASFAELDNDPDRLQAPLIRRDGELVETSWAQALAAAAAGLGRVQADPESSVAVYLGNPNAHTIAGGLYAPQLVRALKTRNVFSASTLDQMPKHVACGYLYGNAFAFTVPDVDRTDHLVVIGANPLVSNGSIATAADFGGKLKALQRRGGRLTVIDPNRTRTAAMADRHIAPRPGTDAALLFAVVNVLFDEELIDADLGGLAPHVIGVEQVQAMALEFPPETVAEHCGVDAQEIRALARDIAAGPRTAVYGRMGTSTVRFGTLTSWLVDVVNVLTGNLDRPGGAQRTGRTDRSGRMVSHRQRRHQRRRPTGCRRGTRRARALERRTRAGCRSRGGDETTDSHQFEIAREPETGGVRGQLILRLPR